MFSHIPSRNKLVLPKQRQLFVAFLLALFFTIPLPMPATSSFVAALLPQPMAALAAAQDHGQVSGAKTVPGVVQGGGEPPRLVRIGNRLWLEDDYDGIATTGTVKPVGAGYLVTALAGDGVTVYTALTNANGYYTILAPANDTYTLTAAQPAGMGDSAVWANTGSDLNNNDRNHNRLGTTVVLTTTDNLSIDFAFNLPTKRVVLGDRLWLEDDNDGDAATGTVTPVAAGHPVTALASDGVTAYHGVTDDDGYYTILVPEYDTYTVTTDRPALVADTPIWTNHGATPLTHNDKTHDRLGTTVLMTETDNLSIDFGFFVAPKPRLVSLGDFVWEDLNNNGQQDSDEPEISQVLVTLTRPDGSTSTTTTNADGLYGFTNLHPNRIYTVTFATPAGYTPTSVNAGADSTDSDPIQGQVVIALGVTHDLTIDAGFVRPVTVGDRVWYDHNHDGHQDSATSEPGVSGVVATLYHTLTNQPVLVHGTPMSDLTDNNGLYLFEKLPPGAYFVVFSNLPAGYQPTLQNLGDDAGDSDAGADGRTASTAFLPSGTEDRTLDLGIWRAPASLGDFVWDDFNHNGLQDGGEPGIPGVTVTLQSDTGTTTTTTDATGHYTFTNLLPGALYTVIFDTPAGYSPTLLNSANTDSDDSDGLSVSVPPLQPGTHNPTLDSGFVQLRPNLVLTKQAMIGTQPVQPGAIVTYSLVYQNTGDDTAVDVIITETVSAQTTFVAQAKTAGWSCSNGAVAGTKCTIKVGNVLPGQSGEVVFAIKINLGVNAGTQIANLALIGTGGNQVEGVSTDNEDEVTITTIGPTNLAEMLEPGQAAFYLYLPVVSQ